MTIKHIDMSGEKPRWVRDPVVSPRFEEGAYKGQDTVHYGVRIPMQGYMPLDLLVKFSRNAQRIIKLPAQDNTGIKYSEMADVDLPYLRAMWFDASDPTFPTTMQGHVGITASLDGEIIGGVVWTPEGNNLFLHHLIAGEKGKELQVSTLLIWQSVVKYCATKWHSLDIGVSYNPKRYRFFENFAVDKYPIILKKPFYTPVIRLSPFRSFGGGSDSDPVDWEKRKMTFAPRGSYAMLALLKHLQLQPDDEVCIQKTFGSTFITRCVTDTIEKVCKWKLREVTEKTKAILYVHEFGIPCKEKPMVAGVPIIEDCAWRDDGVVDSDYRIFSMQKVCNMNYGGLIEGVHIPDDKMWEYGCFDFVKQEKFRYDIDRNMGKEIRRPNWELYHKFVIEDGMTPDDCADYVGMIERKEWTPTVYLQKFSSDKIADDIVARLEEFGIQAGRYWGEPVVYMPIHQNMTASEVEYMFAVVKGYFNACRDYGK